MRITEISANNFLTHRDMLIRVNKHSNVLFICGHNGAGKTALATGIKLALTGDLIRGIEYKKDLPKLITRGADKGYIAVAADINGVPQNYKLSLKTGNHGTNAPPLDGSAIALDPHAFSRMDQSARRKLLFSMAGLEVKASTVTELLVKKGHDAARVGQVTKYLKLGFDGTADEAAKLATEARGMWKAETGENYGEAKAESWRARAPSFDEPPDIAALEAAVEALTSEAEEAGKAAYAMDQDEELHKRAEGARSATDGLDAAREALTARREDLEESAKTLANLETAAKHSGSHTMVCPCCSKVLVEREGKLVEWETVKPTVDPVQAFKALPDLREKHGDLQARVRNLEQTVARGEAASELLKDLPVRPAPDKLKAARALHAEKQAKLTVAKGDLNRAKGAADEAAQVEQRTRKARDYHLDVQAFSSLAKAIRELPTEFLGTTLSTFNERLKEASEGVDETVQLGPDLLLYYGVTPYDMASESEQWRVDMAIGYAFATIGGLGVTVLDRFDCVEHQSRGAILKWMATQTDVQVILAGTLKEPPKLPGAFQVEWIG